MSKQQSDYYIKSIKKAVQVLNAFILEEKELGITELSNKLKISKSVIHRILITLSSEKIIVKNQVTQKYFLGIHLFKLGSVVVHQMEIRKYALPIMQDLSFKTKESIYLNVISGSSRVSIEKVESTNLIRRVIKLGENLPLYAGASGKVLLAYFTDEEIKYFLEGERLIRYTSNTITDPKRLLKNLKEIRKQGFAIAVGERVPGSTAIAFPIFNYTNKAIASLAISGPSERFSEEKIQEFISLLKEKARNISNSLGYFSY